MHKEIDGQSMQLDAPAVLIHAPRSEFTEVNDSTGEPSALFEEKIAKVSTREFLEVKAFDALLQQGIQIASL